MTQRFPGEDETDETAFNWVIFLSLQGSESELSENLETDFVVHFNKRGNHLIHHANEGLAVLAVPYCFNKDQGLLIANSMRYFIVYDLCHFAYHFIFGNEFVVLQSFNKELNDQVCSRLVFLSCFKICQLLFSAREALFFSCNCVQHDANSCKCKNAFPS